MKGAEGKLAYVLTGVGLLAVARLHALLGWWATAAGFMGVAMLSAVLAGPGRVWPIARKAALVAVELVLLAGPIAIVATLAHEGEHVVQATRLGDTNIVIVLNPFRDTTACPGVACTNTIDNQDTVDAYSPGDFWWGEGMPTLVGHLVTVELHAAYFWFRVGKHGVAALTAATEEARTAVPIGVSQ